MSSSNPPADDSKSPSKEPVKIYFAQCRYPMWANNQPSNGLFCEAPTVMGAYCAVHARVCYLVDLMKSKKFHR